MDLDLFDEKEYFKYNKFYQKFNCEDECKIYYINSFLDSNHRFSIYSIKDTKNEKRILWYLQGNEILSDIELLELSKYCDCSICKSYIKIGCRCCSGCILGNDEPSDFTIKRFRDLKENAKKKKNSNFTTVEIFLILLSFFLAVIFYLG